MQTRGTLAMFKKVKPYIFMASTICNRKRVRAQRENSRKFKSLLALCLALLTASLSLAPSAFAADKAPGLSILPWQLIGTDNEFFTRNHEKLAALHQQLAQSLVNNAQPLDTWIAAQGRTLPYNLQHSLHPVLAGESKSGESSPAYVVPILCRIGPAIIVATELVDLQDNRLIAAKQKFTPDSAWENGTPISLGTDWAESLKSDSKPKDPDAPAFKLALGLLRSSSTTLKGQHECFNMLLGHELHKTFAVPTPLDLLEGYRLRQTLLGATKPIRSTRTLLVDWGMKPEFPKLKTQVLASESVLGSEVPPRQEITFEVRSGEDRLVVPDELMNLLKDKKNALLVKDKPQVAKIFGAWVYLDRGRAWGLDMNDRLYFEDGGRFVKGHVVGFFGSGLGLKSPRGFPIEEGAIVFIRKGQRQVKVGDSFDFDPTEFPTPWPPVRQPSKTH